MLKETLHKVRDVHAYPSVTILMSTYRTAPNIKKNPVVFKNLLDDAKDRLLQEFEMRQVKKIFENLDAVAKQMNFRRNLDSLAIFVNNEVCEFVRMPISVENRVVIDHTFATRDLLRAIQSLGNYYLLVLGQKQARLYELFGDTVLEEIYDGKFPMKVGSLDVTGKDRADGEKYDYVKEFFNRVDKELMEVYRRNPLPIAIAGTRRNYDSYMEVADKKKAIIGFVVRNTDQKGLHEVSRDAWELMQTWMEEKEEQALRDLDLAVSAGKIASDLNVIWQYIGEGRGEVLYVESGYFQPGHIEDGCISFAADATAPGVIDDVIDEIIEYQQRFGGNVVFVEDGDLSRFNRIALKLRY